MYIFFFASCNSDSTDYSCKYMYIILQLLTTACNHTCHMLYIIFQYIYTCNLESEAEHDINICRNCPMILSFLHIITIWNILLYIDVPIYTYTYITFLGLRRRKISNNKCHSCIPQYNFFFKYQH